MLREDAEQRARRDANELRTRGILLRRFDPHEPRDPHSGKWSSLGAHVAHEVHKLGGEELHLHAHPDKPGHVTLTHREHSVTLSGHELKQFDRHLARDSRKHIVGSRYEERRPNEVHSVPLYLISHGAADDEGITQHHGLTIAHPDDSHAELLARQGVSMTRAQMEHLNNGLTRMEHAARVDTGNGPLDLIPHHDAVGFRMLDENGKPTEVSFAEQDWAKVDHAINLALEGYDESDPNENAPELNHLTVKTSLGPVDIDYRGKRQDIGYAPDSAITITPAYDAPWSIAIDGSRMSQVFDRLSWAATAAGIDDVGTPASKSKWLTVR
jgi:hypothetical protein